jgi:hypothetical protein
MQCRRTHNQVLLYFIHLLLTDSTANERQPKGDEKPKSTESPKSQGAKNQKKAKV